MHDIRLKLNEAGRGAFYLDEGQERLAEMEVSVSKGVLTVYHTEVAERLKGKGVAGDLMKTMVSCAREKKLKVVPLCPYVHSRFKKDPDAYADLWKPGNS